MFRLLSAFKRRFPFLWRGIEYANGVAVRLRYGNAVRDAADAALCGSDACGCSFRRIEKCELQRLAEMLCTQPRGFDRYFKPHDFDLKSLQRLHSNPSFLMLGAFEQERIVGYCFIRFFANGKAFRGKMVDHAMQGRGIAKQMGRIMTDIALGAGFRLFATISEANIRSLASSQAVNELRIIERLPNGYIYVEYTKKQTS